MTTIDLPGGDRLLLHGLSAPEGDRGAVERMSAKGRVWIAHPPRGEGQDAFIAVRIEHGQLVADSFQGLSLQLDLATGAVLGQAFVK